MRYFVISDTHFDHAAICKYCGRPENFAELITKHWNTMVGPDDYVIHLGDVMWGGDTHMKELKGHKILVRGNHDHQNTSFYINRGFDFVCDSFTLYYGGLDIVFTHQPLIFHEHELNIHGHIHNSAAVETPCQLYCICLENNGYKPELLDTIVSKFNKKS